MLTPSPEIRGEPSTECDAPVTDRGGNIAAVRISVFSLAASKAHCSRHGISVVVRHHSLELGHAWGGRVESMVP